MKNPFRREQDPLDKRIAKLPDGSYLTVRHLLTSFLVLGQTGSGKTSGSYLWILRIMLGIPNSGGLILGSKPEERRWVEDRFREAGRIRDLIIVSEDSPARFNLLAYELKSRADSRRITNLLMTISEVLEPAGKPSEPYWKVLEGPDSALGHRAVAAGAWQDHRPAHPGDHGFRAVEPRRPRQ